MPKKADFIIFTFLLLFTRGLDFYSTSLWFFNPQGMDDETNPLTYFLGLGWNGLVVVNILLILWILHSYYYYCFIYEPKKFIFPPNDFKSYVSLLYFGSDNMFYKIFYSLPKNKSASRAHFGYMVIRVVIIGGLLASMHNFFQYYDFFFYEKYRGIVKRPLYVFYIIMLLSIFYFHYKSLKIEFDERHF
jgi:hypothetical protein